MLKVSQIIDDALSSVEKFDQEKVAQEKLASAPKTEVAKGLRKLAESLRSIDPERLTVSDVKEYIERLRAR